MAEQTHFVADVSNTKTFNNWGFWSSGGGIDLVYNGINVVYFPKSYVEKGFTTGTLNGYTYPTSGGYSNSSGNVLWFGNGTFLNQNTWDYLKPTKLDQSLVNVIGPKTINPKTYTFYWSVTGQTYQTAFDMRDVPDFADGYIIERSKFYELAKSTANASSSNDGRIFGWSPYRIPSGLGTAPDGNLSYVGYTTGGANDRRSDLYYINNSDSAKQGVMQYAWQDCGWFGCSFSDFLGSTLGQLLTLGARIYSPWFNLGYTVGNFAFNDGKIGDVALAVINLNMPTTGGTTPAGGTIFEIPQIASMGSKLAEFYTPYLGAEAAKAASFVTVNTGLNYLANGQNFEQAIASAAAQYVGNQAGAQVAKSLASFGTDVQKIMSATSTAVTKAALLNQDVEQAGLSAFVTTSIPLAVDGALKSANLTLSSNVKKTISDAAIQAALLPNANVDEILRSAAIGGLTRAVSDKVSSDSVASKVIKSDDKAAMDKIFAYVGQYFSGRSVDEIVNSSIVNDALRAADLDIKDYSATMKGWANWDQFQTAQRLFGSDVTPEFYDARVVSREKIIPILQQEGVPESDWQNIIDFYEGTVGADSTAAQVLGDIRNFVNPLYMTGAEREYVTRAFAGLEEFDQEKYQALYDQALDLAKRNQYGAVEEIVNWVNQNYTSTNEAINLWKEAFKFVGVDDYQPTQQQIDMIKGRNQIAAYTIAQHIAGERSVTFDATQFSNPKEAEEAARKANFNNFEFNDGIVYKVTTPINEALIRDEIAKQPTYADALGKARAELGPGKTFMYGGTQYTTNIAPTGVYDASMSSDVGQSALLAWSNNKDVFLARNGKIYTIPENVKTQLTNAANQSPAEIKRLLEQSIKAAPETYLNETARLLNYTGKGDMDWFSASKAMALGTSLAGFAQFIEEGSKTFDLFRGNYNFDNSGVQLAKEINQLGEEQMPYGLDLQKYRFAVALNEVANEKDPLKQTEMFAQAVNNNKMAFISIAGTEAAAELPYIAAFVGASLALAPLGAPAVLLGSGAIAIASGIMEAAGTAGKSAYDAAKAQGDSEQVARDKAAQNAAAASLIEMGTDFAANKFLLGSVAKNGMPSIMKAVGVGASNAAVGGVTDLVQGYSQSIAEQLIVNPDTASANKAFADGLLEMTIGGTARGVLGIAGYALMPNTVIGKDYSGGNVTLNDILLHDKVLDSSTVDPNVVVGRTGNNNSFTLGGMFTNMPTYNFNTQIQQTYLPQIYNNPEMVVGFDALGNNVTYGQILSRTNDQTSYEQAFNTVVNPTFEQKNQIQKDFLTDQFQNIGFTPKEEDINSLIVDNPGGNQALINAAKTVSFREIAAQENYQLSDAVLANLLKPGSGINTADQFKAYVDPQAVTAEEAARFLAERDEAAPTQDQLARLMAGTEADALNIAREIDEANVTEAEARQAYDTLGLKKPTQADIQKLVGQYAESELAGRAQANLAEARINSIFDQLNNLSVGATPEVMDAVNKVRSDLLSQLESMGVDVSNIAREIGGVSEEVTNLRTDLLAAIEDAKQSGLTGDAALQAAINSVSAELGTTKDDVLAQLGTTEAALRADFATQLGGVQQQVTDVEARLAQAIEDAKQSGLTGDAALQQAIDDVTASLGTTKADLLAQLGTTESALREELGAGLAGVSAELQAAYDALTAEQKALADSVLAQGKTLTEALAAVESGLSGQITDVEERLQKAISDNEAAGLTRDEALQAALDSVSGELGTTRADLLAQLGTTEEALRAELASGLAGVSAELQAAYNALSAEQKALADSQREQGATLAEAIATAQAQTAQQITDVESRFTSALAAAEAAGMSRDEALQQALTDVAADLGTTRSDLLSRLGTTEDALRAEFGTGLAGVSAEVKAAYDALSAEQKSLADTLVAQGATLTEAIESVQASLSGQISGLSADLQAKYDTLTAGQKDIVDRLVQQGDSLTTAINTVSSELSGQIQASAAETQATLLAKMREYEQAGLSRDEAMNRAIGDVSTELGVTRNQLSTQIGRPAVQDDPATIDVNEAQAPTGIYKIMADYDAAAAQRDLELQEQMEAEALARRIEAQERSSAAQRAQLLGKAPSLLQQGVAGILPFLGAAAVASDDGAKFKSPFITSKTGQEEFGGTLEEFQKRVAQTDYTSPEFGDAQMQEFMGMPQNTEQGESMPNYFTYGEQSDIDRMFNPFASAAASFNPFQPMLAAKGGLAVLMANGGYAGGGLPVVHHSGKQRLDFREGAAVSGPGDGQSDDIPAMLADGEFVFPADVVAALGNGSTKAGSDKLYDMMHSIRAYHRSAKPQDLPPPAKASPLDYLKKSRR